jgi:HK97 family phage major capsid protein
MTDINSTLTTKVEEMNSALDARIGAVDAEFATRDAEIEALKSRAQAQDDAIAELTRQAVRPAVVPTEAKKDDFKAEFRNYLINGVSTRAVSTLTPQAGGYAVPEQFDANMVQLAVDVSPLLGEVTVTKTSTPDVKIHVNKRGTTSAWVSEGGTDGMYGETATPELAEIAVPFGMLFAKPLISNFALNDVYFDAEAFVTQNVGLEFSQKVNASILNGTGVGQPKGILQHARGTAFGQIETIKTKAAAALTSDSIIDLVHSLKAAHRAGAKFVMNRTTLAEVRKLKDGDGNYLWQQSFEAGNPGTLVGYGIIEAEDMPNVGAGNTPILFANLKEYRLYDLVGMDMLRDPYSYDAYVALKTSKRFGGTVADAEAFKLLVCAA